MRTARARIDTARVVEECRRRRRRDVGRERVDFSGDDGVVASVVTGDDVTRVERGGWRAELRRPDPGRESRSFVPQAGLHRRDLRTRQRRRTRRRAEDLPGPPSHARQELLVDRAVREALAEFANCLVKRSAALAAEPHSPLPRLRTREANARQNWSLIGIPPPRSRPAQLHHESSSPRREPSELERGEKLLANLLRRHRRLRAARAPRAHAKSDEYALDVERVSY